MSKKKTLLMLLLILVMTLSVVLGLFWHMGHYVIVEGQFYPKGVLQLDLRDREITIRHYKKLLRRMPDCEILWNVPFQGTAVPCDVEELAVSALSLEDIRNLEYFSQLKTVKADNCTDYENLLALWQQRPDLQVSYAVPIGTEVYCAEAEEVLLTEAAPEEISRLAYLPRLKRVLCSGGGAEAVSLLRDYCQSQQVEFVLFLGE